MFYFDTSFIVPYYVNEASSDAVAALLSGVPAGQLVVSEWTRVEFASQLARRVRMGELDTQLANTIMTAFEQDLKSAFHVLELEQQDYTQASRLLLVDPALGLRGPDALHLALASRYQTPLYTLDVKLIQAAAALDLSATDAGVLGTG